MPNPTEYRLMDAAAGGAKTMWDAEAACVADGGHLASMHSDNDKAAIGSRGYGAGSSAWIGLHDVFHESGRKGEGFVWTDGTTQDYEAWRLSPAKPC